MPQARRFLPLSAFLILFVFSSVLAQHGGGMHDHDGPPGGMGGHMEMGEMHGGEMMNHMNMVMEQMSEMMQEMHGTHGMHLEMMQDMAGDMESMTAAMQSMFERMQGYMNSDTMAGDDAMREHMNTIMENLNTMMG